MADFVNKSASILSVGGKDYAPGATMPLNAEQQKDPTVDFWKREGFIAEGKEGGVRGQQVAYIPTVEESLNGATVRMTDVSEAAQPVTPDSTPPKTDGAKR